jgi:hypothetical protein
MASTRLFPDLAGQGGLATRRQLLDAGWTYSAVRHALSTGWQKALPGVFAPHSGSLSGNDVLTAAALWAGDRAVLTAWSALRIFQLAVRCEDKPLTFLVPRTRRPQHAPGVRTHRTSRMPLLLTELTSSRLNDLAPVNRGLAQFLGGAWSRPEAVLHELLDSAPGLPGVLFNPELRTVDDVLVAIPDAYLHPLGIAIQVHSREFHTGTDADGRDRWTETVGKDNRLVAHGVMVLAVTPTTLARNPQVFLRQLVHTVDAHEGRPPPDLVVIPVSTSSAVDRAG